MASAAPMTPLRYVPVAGQGYDIEGTLHAKFAHLHVRGEWFKATPELLDFARHGSMPEPDPARRSLTVAKPEGSLSLSQLSEKTGVPARTLRYYIATGVLSAPIGAGRASHYTNAHVEQIRDARTKQASGWTLDSIAKLRAATEASASDPVVNSDGTPTSPQTQMLEATVFPSGAWVVFPFPATPAQRRQAIQEILSFALRKEDELDPLVPLRDKPSFKEIQRLDEEDRKKDEQDGHRDDP